MRIFILIRNIIFLSLPSLILGFVMLELIFTYVIPASQYPTLIYDQSDKILKYDTCYERDGIYTVGRFCQPRGKWHINLDGWNSPIEFLSERAKPLIAVIGDSYVEAFHVNLEDNFVSKLRTKLSSQYDVYGFGMSGAPLSQYLQMSRYVNAHYHPQVLIFTVIHNDFDESLCSMTRSPGILCLETRYGNMDEAAIRPYFRNKIIRVLKKSSFIRYLNKNLSLINRFNLDSVVYGVKRNKNAVNVSALGSVGREAKSERLKINKATDYVLSQIKDENPDSRIVFIIDAPRHDIYNNSLSASRLMWMNSLLKELCLKYGFYFIDLTYSMAEDYNLKQIKFNSKWDYHWNEYGNDFVAQVLYEYLVAHGLV